MAKVMKEQGALEIALHERNELQKRLTAEEEGLQKLREELDDLRAKRTDPTGTVDGDLLRRRSMEVRGLIIDGETIVADLRQSIAARDQEINRLSLEVEKRRVAQISIAVEAEYTTMMAEIKETVAPRLADWLKKAGEAAGEYGSVNGTSNMSLSGKIQMAALLADYIKSA